MRIYPDLGIAVIGMTNNTAAWPFDQFFTAVVGCSRETMTIHAAGERATHPQVAIVGRHPAEPPGHPPQRLDLDGEVLLVNRVAMMQCRGLPVVRAR
jgi:hypothetical protein